MGFIIKLVYAKKKKKRKKNHYWVTLGGFLDILETQIPHCQ